MTAVINLHAMPIADARAKMATMMETQLFDSLRGRPSDAKGTKYGLTLKQLKENTPAAEDVDKQAPWTIPELQAVWPRVASLVVHFATDPYEGQTVFVRRCAEWADRPAADQPTEMHDWEDVLSAIVERGQIVFVLATYFPQDALPFGIMGMDLPELDDECEYRIMTSLANCFIKAA